MQSDYTEQDTERAREQEHSSAGLETQRLPAPPPVLEVPPPPAPHAPPPPADRRGNLPALALLVVGGLLLLGQVFPGRAALGGGMVLLTIASCFLFFAFWRRIYGLLIPGCILGGLSVGVTFAGLTNGVSVLWGLALGFLSIYLVGRALFGVHSPWPVIPAVPLFAVGVIVAASSLPAFLAGGLVWLPLLLIAAGLYLFQRSYRAGR
ncbi:MAG TPA: hypothetical protein VNL77_09500 [Roseiflexaceae bacterium]|nr:hypothetical protein [Roseiflexaceae bacterium]